MFYLLYSFNFLDIPWVLAVNKYDLIEEYVENGNKLDDFMEDEFLEVFWNKYDFIGFKKISAKKKYSMFLI